MIPLKGTGFGGLGGVAPRWEGEAVRAELSGEQECHYLAYLKESRHAK